MSAHPRPKAVPCPVGVCDSVIPILFHSSCIQIAKWTPLELARFRREDAEDERLERSQRCIFAPEETGSAELDAEALEQLRGAPARPAARAAPDRAEVAEAVLATRRAS